VTRDGILEVLWTFCTQSYSQDLERAWIFYSGHGTNLADTGGDEKDGKDEQISPSDAHQHGHISDDLLHRILRQFNPNTQVLCVFDSCFSGTLADLQYRSLRSGHSTEDNKGAACPSNVICLSATLDRQVAAETDVTEDHRAGGVLTTALVETLYAYSKANTPFVLTNLLQEVRSKVEQRKFPQDLVVTSSRPLDPTLVLTARPPPDGLLRTTDRPGPIRRSYQRQARKQTDLGRGSRSPQRPSRRAARSTTRQTPRTAT